MGYSLDLFFPDLNADFSNNINLYCMQENDSLESIAIKHKTSVSFILYLNEKLKDPKSFYVGQVIKLPGDKVIELIESKGKSYQPLINKLGSNTFRLRKEAMIALEEKDWRAVPILIYALNNKDVEIRGNAKDTLKNILMTRKDIDLNF